MEVLVKKLYKGRVDVRSHDRQFCIDTKQSMTIIHNGGRMTLTPRELKNKIKAKSKKFFAEQSNGGYYLYSYDWIPD